MVVDFVPRSVCSVCGDTLTRSGQHSFAHCLAALDSKVECNSQYMVDVMIKRGSLVGIVDSERLEVQRARLFILTEQLALSEELLAATQRYSRIAVQELARVVRESCNRRRASAADGLKPAV